MDQKNRWIQGFEGRSFTLYQFRYKDASMSRTDATSPSDQIEPDSGQAAAIAARSALMHAIRDCVEGWKTTQTDAARRLGITQPRLNALLRGRLDRFSLDALIALATSAGLHVSISVQKTA